MKIKKLYSKKIIFVNIVLKLYIKGLNLP